MSTKFTKEKSRKNLLMAIKYLKPIESLLTKEGIELLKKYRVVRKGTKWVVQRKLLKIIWFPIWQRFGTELSAINFMLIISKAETYIIDIFFKK